jgi:hypothetical protein
MLWCARPQMREMLPSYIEGCFGFNNKIMIKESRHLVSWSLKNLWSTRVWVRELVVQGKNTSPPVHLTQGKLHCWLIINSTHVSIRWSHLKFRVDLISWGNLYLIKLNPNHFKTLVLELHLFSILNL